MAYIGKNPTTGSFLYADDITTSATNTYNITVGGVAFSPQESSHVICSLNGVIQKGGGNNPSFTISGSQITFLPSSGTLSSSDSIDFILILGSVNDVGVATTVTDSAITKSKLNLISDSSSAGLTVKGDGSSKNGQIQINCHQNSHGIKLSSPDHSAGQSYELIFPTGNVTADKFLKVASVSGSGATGIGQLSFADAGGITEADQWRITANHTSSADLTSNWERNDSTGYSKIGTGLSESSGIFSFASTGIYLINFYGMSQMAATDGYMNFDLQVTTNNSSYTVVATALSGNDASSGDAGGTAANSYIFDVTDTSTHKFKFSTGSFTSGTYLTGSSTVQFTGFNMIRLGNT